jgi:hypothetical protein
VVTHAPARVEQWIAFLQEALCPNEEPVQSQAVVSFTEVRRYALGAAGCLIDANRVPKVLKIQELGQIRRTS